MLLIAGGYESKVQTTNKKFQYTFFNCVLVAKIESLFIWQIKIIKLIKSVQLTTLVPSYSPRDLPVNDETIYFICDTINADIDFG